MSQDPQTQRIVLAGTVGQIGCVTAIVAIAIIVLAGGAGLLLDNMLGNERQILTVLFILGSFPVTLFAMVRVSLMLVARAERRVSQLERNQKEEDKEITHP